MKPLTRRSTRNPGITTATIDDFVDDAPHIIVPPTIDEIRARVDALGTHLPYQYMEELDTDITDDGQQYHYVVEYSVWDRHQFCILHEDEDDPHRQDFMRMAAHAPVDLAFLLERIVTHEHTIATLQDQNRAMYSILQKIAETTADVGGLFITDDWQDDWDAAIAWMQKHLHMTPEASIDARHHECILGWRQMVREERARVGALEDALDPFAALAASLPHGLNDANVLYVAYNAHSITVGDVRHAARVLAGKPEIPESPEEPT